MKHITRQRILTAILLAAILLSAFSITAYADYWNYAYLDEYPPDWSEGGPITIVQGVGWGGSAKRGVAGGSAWGKWHNPFCCGAGTQVWWAWIPYNTGDLDAWVYYELNPGSGSGYPEWHLIHQELYADEWVYISDNHNAWTDSYMLLAANACEKPYEYPEVWWDEAYIAWHFY